MELEIEGSKAVRLNKFNGNFVVFVLDLCAQAGLGKLTQVCKGMEYAKSMCAVRRRASESQRL